MRRNAKEVLGTDFRNMATREAKPLRNVRPYSDRPKKDIPLPPTTSRDGKTTSSGLSPEMNAMVNSAHKRFLEMRGNVDQTGQSQLQSPMRDFHSEYQEKYWASMKRLNSDNNITEVARRKIQELLRETKLWYRVQPRTLIDILAKGETFKTVHETGTTGGPPSTDRQSTERYQETRLQLEAVYFDCSAKDLSPEQTPLSVYLTGSQDGNDPFVRQYGSVAIRFKDELRERTYAMLGDSYTLGTGAQTSHSDVPDKSPWVPGFVHKALHPDPAAAYEYQVLSPELGELENRTPNNEKIYSLPTPLTNPGIECWPKKDWSRTTTALQGQFSPNFRHPTQLREPDSLSVTSYMEGLVDRRRGPVTRDHIEEVVFHDDKIEGVAGLIALLQREKIPYRVSRQSDDFTLPWHPLSNPPL